MLVVKTGIEVLRQKSKSITTARPFAPRYATVECLRGTEVSPYKFTVIFWFKYCDPYCVAIFNVYVGSEGAAVQ